MLETIRVHFIEYVLPEYKAYDEYRLNPETGLKKDLRLAANAATTLTHFADHIFETLRGTDHINFKSLAQYHEYLNSECSDFAVLKDCSNAFKHKNLTKKNAKVRSFNDISEFVVLTEYSDSQGPYRIATKEVRVILLDGTVRIVHDVLLSVRKMWFVELARLGISLPSSSGVESLSEIPSRISATGAANVNFQVRRGESLNTTFELRRYDAATGESHPIDVSGWEFTAQIITDSAGGTSE